MRYTAILAAALVVGACSGRKDTVSDTAAGGLATDSVGAAGTAGTTDSLSDSARTRDTGAAAATARGGTGTGGTGGASAAGTASATNQTQSGVTNAKTGKSTLGPNVKKLDPTGGARTVNAEQGVVRDTLRVRRP